MAKLCTTHAESDRRQPRGLEAYASDRFTMCGYFIESPRFDKADLYVIPRHRIVAVPSCLRCLRSVEMDIRVWFPIDNLHRMLAA